MLTRVLHTGLEVADLSKAIELYKTLGFVVDIEFDKTEPEAKAAIISKGDVAFELWQFVDPKHPLAALIRNHVAFHSDDIKADVQAFVDDGYKLVIPITEGVILRYAYVQDASGLCYEIATEKSDK